MTAAAERHRFIISGGRIVQGSPTFKQDKDYYGKPKEKPNWFLAVAVPKSHPSASTALNTIMQIAWNGYQNAPNILQQIQAGLGGNFRWKVEDGDAAINASKEGFAGCWVFNLSTSLGVPPCVNMNYQPIDPNSVRTGHYADVAVSCLVNGLLDANAGVYLNPDMIMVTGLGQEIQSGPPAQQLFAGHVPQVPAGASPTTPGFAQGAVAGATTGGPAATTAPGFSQATASPFNTPAVGPGNAAQVFPGATPHQGFGR